MACDSTGSFYVCNKKRKPGEKLCGVHLNSERKREDRRQASIERAGEKWKRDDQLTKDRLAAAAELGVQTNRNGHIGMHAEDFLALCRELTELREMREMM